MKGHRQLGDEERREGEGTGGKCREGKSTQHKKREERNKT